MFGTTVDFVFHTDSTLSGHFRNQYRKGDYKVPFTGVKSSLPTPVKSAISKSSYDVTMGENDDAYKAIGIFKEKDERITGTFLTETGDYRFLEGKRTAEDEFYLSCFDGSHLFYFSAKTTADSISGKFYSGNHWHTLWNGRMDNSISLVHPDSLTVMNEGKDMVEFGGKNMNGDSLEFNSAEFDKTTLVQILGSWCPNCLDETRYYNELKKKYGDRIDIIGLAFEIPGDEKTQLESIQTYKTELDVQYPIYLSGDASKADASVMFSELNNIISFPTTLFLDKNGIVRKIHTGFYGPGTGEYYTNYVSSTESFLDALIEE